MVGKTKTPRPRWPKSLIPSVRSRLSRNERVRRTLPGGGRLHIDRQVPFLCVYRQPPDSEDAGTQRLVKGEASYLIAPGDPKDHDQLSQLVTAIVETLAPEFGAFLIVEIWTGPEGGRANDPTVPNVSPRFTIHAPKTAKLTPTVEALSKRLRKIKILKQSVNVKTIRDGQAWPPNMPPLIDPDLATRLHCWYLGLEVPPVFRKPNSPKEFPVLISSLRRNLSLALRQTYFEFARSLTTETPPHFHSLGRRAVVKAVWEIDRQLASVSDQFDYLLQLTPVNASAAWKEFKQSGFERVPEFHYRPLPIDPALLLRQLFRIPIERVEDPALQRLFQEKRDELELKLIMLRDHDTPRFLYESMALFGPVKDRTLRIATDLLDHVPPPPPSTGQIVDAEQFAEAVSEEIEYYRQQNEAFKAGVQITSEVSGLIVSRGKLMINADLELAHSRVAGLLAHEVSTHLLTYYNGRLQPFRQLYSGLAGYEELQEGLAVLSEYLVDSLTPSRLRQLAARVLAVRQMCDGATFVDVFRTLHHKYEFGPRTSYNVTMRVFRGGGLTKDAIYLRGLIAILGYLGKGGDLAPLMVGKMALKHIPIIRELQYRNVLKPAAFTPRYLTNQLAQTRLADLRNKSVSVLDLVAKI